MTTGYSITGSHRGNAKVLPLKPSRDRKVSPYSVWRPAAKRGAYDAVYGVKDSPATMALPGALVGRFTDWDPPVSPDSSSRPPVALSRRAKARLRAAQGR